MGTITADQSRQVIAVLMVNTDWGSIDFQKSGLQDAVIRDPKGAGARFTAFLKNGASMQLTDSSEASVLNLVNDNVQIDAVVSYDPSGFKTRPGLWVSDDFHSCVSSEAKPVENLSAITLSSFDLSKAACDKDIKSDSNMPPSHVFGNESEFVAHLDQMISRQPNGEDGDLLNDGFWNIFYVAGCVGGVYWSVESQEWSFQAWSLDGKGWGDGVRVFARN